MSLCQKYEANKIQSIKPELQNIYQFGKKVEAKHYLRGQIWGQVNFWNQSKNLFGTNFEAKIWVKPTLRPGQAHGARPDFIVCYIVIFYVVSAIITINVELINNHTYWQVCWRLVPIYSRSSVLYQGCCFYIVLP